MLSWYIGETEVLDVLRGKKITEDMVEVIPKNVNNACTSDVCAWLKSKDPLLMNDDAWKIVINIVTMKNEKCNYFCPVCKLKIDD